MASRIVAVGASAVGASAGGVSALGELLSRLPHDLDATVLVGLHLSSTGPSLLAQVLSRRSALPVRVPQPGAPLQPGTVVVAAPDRHLLVSEGRLVLGQGAKENGHRPSHDAMMRSVALQAGPDAVGVVLTGLLDDGSAGLRCIARYGGACLVQEPHDADFGDMPRNALRAVPEAQVATLASLAELVVDAVRAVPREAPEVAAEQRALDAGELASGLGRSTRLPDGSHPGNPSTFACPDCHGVLNDVLDGDVVRYRCRTGHAWSAASLLAEQRESVEDALWIALKALEERADMHRSQAARAHQRSDARTAQHHLERAAGADSSAASLRALLVGGVGVPAALPVDR